MYSATQLALKYLAYYLSASNAKGHGIHSPFLFDFVAKVLNDRQHYDDYSRLEHLRKRMRKDKRRLKVDDYGAGVSKPRHRAVGSIAKQTVTPRKYAQLLYRVSKFYQPQTIIELGTSLGLTTGYLSSSNPAAKIFTFEGATEISSVAKENFQLLELNNIQQVEGNFDYTLPSVLYYLPSVDFAFIDGNHRYEPTLNYFSWLTAKAGNNSIFIFDDIHWSRAMEDAWKSIKGHPAVRCTVDLFFMGIVFFRSEFRESQHFKIRF